MKRKPSSKKYEPLQTRDQSAGKKKREGDTSSWIASPRMGSNTTDKQLLYVIESNEVKKLSNLLSGSLKS